MQASQGLLGVGRYCVCLLCRQGPTNQLDDANDQGGLYRGVDRVSRFRVQVAVAPGRKTSYMGPRVSALFVHVVDNGHDGRHGVQVVRHVQVHTQVVQGGLRQGGRQHRQVQQKMQRQLPQVLRLELLVVNYDGATRFRNSLIIGSKSHSPMSTQCFIPTIGLNMVNLVHFIPV